VSGAEFVKQLQDEFRDELAINHKIDPKTATLTYPTFENDAADMDFVKPLLAALPGDPKSLHPVLVEFALPENTSTEATVNEGTYVVFIYDAKNTLVGMTFDHYLLD
jgi:hypothetical protein